MAGKSTISITFKLDGDGKGFKSLTADADGLKQVITASVVEAQKLNKSMMDWSLSVQAIGQVSNAVSQLNNTFQQITGESNQFTKAMRAANTMAGKDAAGFKQLKGQVADLAKELPIARDQLANGLYQVISNGVPEDNWLSFLEATAKASIGGLADLNQAVTVTATIIKNYGLAWEDAGSIQDKIQMTAKNGVTTFEQLADALPSVAGSAAQLGVSIDELMAIFATCTGVTGNTAEVSTQLSAVLKALIKPSTEAAKAAEAMGIQFDAAGIRAAGGLDNFLKELDVTIQQYARETGELSETIYGNLFGSARALRLLVSLTGEQADKFTENIGIMADSAGSIDQAFNEMASTGEAAAQKLKNQFAGITDAIAGIMRPAAPIMAFSANVLITVNSVATLTKTLKALNLTQVLTATRAKASGAAMLLLGLNTNKAAAVQRVFNGALRSGTYAATAFKIALRGLMIATGVGIAIAAVTAIIEAFTNKSEDATEQTDRLAEAEDAFKSKFAEVKTALDAEIKKLGELIRAKQDTTEAVAHLNAEYGEIFGTHKTAADWYDTLTTKSKDYAMQLAFEAKAASLNAKIAENAAQMHINAEKMRRMAEAGQDKVTTKRTVTDRAHGEVYDVVTTKVNPEYQALSDQTAQLQADNAALEKELGVVEAAAGKYAASIKGAGDAAAGASKQVAIAEMNLNQVKAKLEANEKAGAATTDPKELARLKAENQQLQARKKVLEDMQGLGKSGSGGAKFTADPKTLKELSDNIEIYKKKLTGADTAEQRAIQAQIIAWQRKKDEIELAQKAAAVPTEIQTLDDVAKALDYLREKRKAASAEDIAGIDAEIAEMEMLQAAMERPVSISYLSSLKDIDAEIAYQRKKREYAHGATIAEIDAEIARLERLKAASENAGILGIPNDQLKSYDQLNAKLSYYRTLLDTATAAERADIQAQIDALEELKAAWDAATTAANIPDDFSQLDSIEKLDKAIAAYTALQKKSSADEVLAIQQTINALEAKRSAIQRSIDIAKAQQEVNDISGLGNREFTLKIRSIGFDELTEKIRSLRRQLADLNNPVTEKQRADIEALIATYESWRSVCAQSIDTYRNAWDGIKGIGNAIQNVTDALEGNGNAWQKVTAIIDAFFSIVGGIKAVITVIEMLNAATTAHTAAKAAETTAVTAEAAAETAAGTQKIATNAAVMASNIALANTNTAVAASGAASAMASIPYIGPILAIAAVASVIAAILAIPKFADGGLAYGPTLGMFGEYAGASNNPEVVAPLDKLRSMLEPSDGFSGKVRFEIAGRTLVGILEKETDLRKRS
jgi:TP901 family phage tail tape measure protein